LRDRRGHGQTVRKGDIFGDVFVRRQRGGDEEDLIERAGLAHLFGDTQMRQMDRIESAAEDADAHGMTVGAILVIALGEYEIRPCMIIA
jgi:hypothetical protein